MAENQIQKMRIPTHAILDLMIANPFASQNDIAQMSGYTPSWISIMVNSDCFKSELNKRRAELAGVLAVEVQTDITANLRSAALGGIKKTTELIANSLNLEQVSNATENVLKLLGYGEPAKKTPEIQQNTVYNIDARQMPQALLNARANFGRPLLTVDQNNGELNDVLPAPESEPQQSIEDCSQSRPTEFRQEVAYHK